MRPRGSVCPADYPPMRTLIDGYNLMHSVVLLSGRRLGPDGLRKARQRFLNQLAELLGPVEAHQTTVVFDSSTEHQALPREASQKGMTILFASPGEEADERIEQLICRHNAPKNLTVVSSDHRIRLAAAERALPTSSDDFWSQLQDRRERKHSRNEGAASPDRDDRPGEGRDDDSSYWVAAFRHVEEMPELRDVSRPADFVPSDEDIARIAREVDEEFRGF